MSGHNRKSKIRRQLTWNTEDQEKIHDDIKNFSRSKSPININKSDRYEIPTKISSDNSQSKKPLVKGILKQSSVSLLRRSDDIGV